MRKDEKGFMRKPRSKSREIWERKVCEQGPALPLLSWPSKAPVDKEAGVSPRRSARIRLYWLHCVMHIAHP